MGNGGDDDGGVLMKKHLAEVRKIFAGHICGHLRRRTPQVDKKVYRLCVVIVLILCLGGCLGCGAGGRDFVTERQVATIKEGIIQEYPALLDKSLSDFEKTNLLRDWAYANSVGGGSTFDEHYDWSRSLAQNFVTLTKDFQDLNLSALCGGFAAYCALVYDAFGYEAISFDSGFADNNGATHVVTLCKIWDGEEKWILQDPTFNRAYVDADGVPLDIYEIMTLLKNGQDSQIHYSFGSTAGRYCLYNSLPSNAVLEDPTTISPGTLDYYPCLLGEVKEFGERYGILYDMRQPDVFQIQIQDTLENHLSALGYPPKADYLYLFPLGLYIGNVSDPTTMLEELQAFAVE